MTSDISRDESTRILECMGIHFPHDTKLTSDNLADKLTKAIDMSQRVADPVPKRIDPNDLEKWAAKDREGSSSDNPLLEEFRKSSMEECAHNWFREQLTGDRNVPLYTDVFSDIRQSLMSVANNYMSPDKHDIFLLEDKEQTYSITFRVLDVHALSDGTPLLSVLYGHGPGLALARARDFLTTRKDSVPRIFATVLEQKLLIRVLEQNSRRLASSFKPQRHYSEKAYIRSFLLPLRALTMENIGSLTKSSCAVCGIPARSKCAACQSVSYCGKECQTTDWKEHKKLCKPLSSGTWKKVCFSLPGTDGMDKGLIGSSIVINKHAVPDEILKRTSSSSNDGPLPNVHGTDPFIVKIQVPIDSSGCPAMMVYDRRRSFTGYIARSADPAVYTQMNEIVRRNGIMGLKIYRWAKRVGDWTLDVCLDAEPKDPVQW